MGDASAIDDALSRRMGSVFPVSSSLPHCTPSRCCSVILPPAMPITVTAVWHAAAPQNAACAKVGSSTYVSIRMAAAALTVRPLVIQTTCRQQ
mgnify:CR=1 FL=1